MKIIFSKYILALFLLVVTLGISACVLQPTEEKNNLFEAIEKPEIITLDGEIYPFSVSISTRATHRLANIDGKLIAYLYSDIVDLSQFESHVVEIDGYWRNEKMQEIFYVEGIRLQDLEVDTKEEIPEFQRFTTKNFTFQYPYNWEFSRSPVGVSHFTNKNDPQRRVLLMFSVEDRTKKDLQQEPNISIGNMDGVRTINNKTPNREVQEIILFSNFFNKKYSFVFSGSQEQRKKFLLLINSFIEGEENVAQELEEEKRILAEREASKLKEKKEKIALEKLETLLDSDSSNSEETDLEENKEESDHTESNKKTDDGSDSINDVAQLADKYRNNEEKIDNTLSQDNANNIIDTNIPLDENFENLIDERAFHYTSDYYNLSLKIPFGYWFRNFGPSDKTLFRIGFAPFEINSSEDPVFWLEGVASENPPQTFEENIENNNLMIEFPRTNASYFRFSGPLEYRDAMRSILLSIE